MKEPSQTPPYVLWPLYAFAASAVASISLQNFIWVAVALFLFFQLNKQQKIDWPHGLFPLATLLFLLSFFAAALWGIDIANSFLNARVHRYLTLLLIFFVAGMPLALADMLKLLVTYVYGAAFCALYGIVYKHFILHQDRIDSFSGDKMVFGGMLMVALLLNLLLLKQRPKDWLLWICSGLIATALVFTQTRGAWLGFIVGLLFLLWNFNRRWLFVGIALLIASYFFIPQVYQERIKSIGNIHMNYSRSFPSGNATQTRLLIWAAGWYMIEDHPWGVGQGNVSKLYPQYKPTVLQEPNEPHLHNNYLQICAQNGWIGLAAYLFWIGAYLATSLKFNGTKEWGGLNWAFICVFISILTWGLTEYTFSQQFMNIQFFLLGLQVNLWKNAGGSQSPLTA